MSAQEKKFSEMTPVEALEYLMELERLAFDLDYVSEQNQNAKGSDERLSE